MAAVGEGNVSGLLVDLESAARIPAKQRAVKVAGVVDRLCTIAYENGLDAAPLEKLVDIVTLPHELDQANLGNLIKNLYPAGSVPDTIVIKIIGSLGHGRAKPSYMAQARLLEWLLMVYDVLENQNVVAQFYGVLFNLLDTAALRPQLCHLLSLITRRKHVRAFRIQILMELLRQVGNEPPLLGVMRVFKEYYPDVIVGEMPARRGSVFKHPNTEWRERLGQIREMQLQRTKIGQSADQQASWENRSISIAAKLEEHSVIPRVHTSQAKESSVTLEEVDNAKSFANNFEKIELPNQLVAVIGDSRLQKLLQLRSSPDTTRRIDIWLSAFFEGQLLSPTSNEILEMLGLVKNYTRYTKQLPPAVLAYFRSMLLEWDGVTGRDLILELLVYTPIKNFNELYQQLFEPLEIAIFLDGMIESRLAIILFYRSLLDEWITILLAGPPIASVATSTISSLIVHMNNLATSITQTSLGVSTVSTILSFYESAAFVISQSSLKSSIRITIPTAELVYTLYFTESLSNLSRLCGILAIYKRAFEVAMAPKSGEQSSPTEPHQSYPKDYVNHFNGFLMDICNCLWRSRAFNTSDLNALGCLLPASTTPPLSTYLSGLKPSLSLPPIFSLSFSPVYSLAAIQHIRLLEDQAEDEIKIRHAGPVTQTSLKQLERDGGLGLPWADYRLGVLHFLEDRGAPGVGELMYNTMKHLMSARESRAA